MYYYELLHPVSATKFTPRVEPGIYAATFPPSDAPALAMTAERIWEEGEDWVMYRKHRECEPPVDMKEFSWIKLKAKEIS